MSAYSPNMASLSPDALVGREREMGVARRLLRGVVDGGSEVLLVQGEAGIGKTSLVRALVHEATEAGLTVLRGDTHPFQQNQPFGALVEALDLRSRSSDDRRAAIGRLLVGDADTAGYGPVSIADARYRVVEEILDLLERLCARGPVALILEDLHWADSSTVVAFSAMAYGMTHMPLLLVGTMRPSPRSQELDQMLDECLTRGSSMVGLGSLSIGEVDSLVKASLGLRAGPRLASIVAKAGGNPLWVVELVRSLSSEGWLQRGSEFAEAIADELPGSLRDLVLRRLHYLPDSALALLQFASALGDAASIHELAAVAGRQPDEVVVALTEAFRSRLLDEHQDEVVFRHQLIQEAIYQDMPRPIRRALHRDAAAVLVRLGADPSRVGTHLLHGADVGDLAAVDLLRRAAAQAATGAPSVAVEFLHGAQALLPQGHPDSDLLASEVADALLRAGQVAEASVAAEAVLDRPHRPDVDVPMRLTLVSALSLQNRTRELVEQSETALRVSRLPLADQALVLAQESYGKTFSGDFIGGESTARRALEVAERSGDAAMTAWSLAALSVPVKTQGRYGEALGLTRRAVALAFEPVNDAARLRHPHFFLAMASCDSDQVEDARLAYARAIEESHTLGSAWLLPDMLLLSAERRFLVGEWTDAAVEMEAGLDLARRHGQRILVAQTRAYQAVMATARGGLAGAASTLADVEGEITVANPSYGAQMVAFARSLLSEAQGRTAEAFDVTLRCWSFDATREVRYYHRYLGPSLVRLARSEGRADVARDVVAAVEASALLAPEVPSIRSAALRCRGLLEGDPSIMLEAATLARRGPRMLDLAGTCEDAASVLAGAGHNNEAAELLLEAQGRYEAVSAVAWAARVGAELRRLGIRQGARGLRSRPESGWDSLTPSERAVSQLVAEGLTNRDVGRRLHISPHTVNTHLRHVFQKLSVSTRAELAGKVARQSAFTDHITRSSDVFLTSQLQPRL
jgi:DNA-binding CsgD family transcriptional regulator